MTIVSFRHRLIFIKTNKTAGTSIEVDLSQRVEDAAVVTPILPPEPGHVARNHLAPDGSPAFYNHMPATEIRDRIGADLFAGMTRVCVEREPVEKCISYYHMLRNSPLHNADGRYRKSWAEYVDEGKFPIDVGRYSETVDGRRVCLATHVLRYDRLDTELPALLDELGIAGFDLKARAKSGYSRNVLVAPGDVTASQRRKIYDRFVETLEVSGIDWST